ncbi:hypothetical protein ACFTUC_38185 [Streptomyces sp. NPDC056944]|uniref:hypothetical protein n=1 Tax=unclassified Streptomyces TaxID=2593676 RepID=UPI003640310C
MDAGAAAVLAATVAGLASAVGVTASALITGRTAVSQAATASLLEREKLRAEKARQAFEVRFAGYGNFHAAVMKAVQHVVALAEGERSLVMEPNASETRVTVREVRVSLQKDVLMLGDAHVAGLADAAVRELENAYLAASVLAARAGEGDAQLSWEHRYNSLQQRLDDLSRSMGEVMFGTARQ